MLFVYDGRSTSLPDDDCSDEETNPNQIKNRIPNRNSDRFHFVNSLFACIHRNLMWASCCFWIPWEFKVWIEHQTDKEARITEAELQIFLGFATKRWCNRVCTFGTFGCGNRAGGPPEEDFYKIHFTWILFERFRQSDSLKLNFLLRLSRESAASYQWSEEFNVWRPEFNASSLTRVQTLGWNLALLNLVLPAMLLFFYLVQRRKSRRFFLAKRRSYREEASWINSLN